jgi:hypothetical protein
MGNNESGNFLTAHPDSYRDVSCKTIEHKAPLWGAGPFTTYSSTYQTALWADIQLQHGHYSQLAISEYSDHYQISLDGKPLYLYSGLLRGEEFSI